MSGSLVAIVMVLVIAGFLATQMLSRLGSANRAQDQTAQRLAALADAIDQFVAASGRLPCPADPTLPVDSNGWGLEAIPATNNGTCMSAAGTVPWRTIGARQEDAIDGWGWKVSYRVFLGTAGSVGSLTQVSGVTMVECDLVDPTAGAATAITGPASVEGGVCVTNTDPTQRSTRAAVFLANKGLSLTDMSPPQKTDIAYVLVSHGPTGLGAYAGGGGRNAMPSAGDELNNTNASGPFMIKSHSAPGTDPTDSSHFDDRLLYRTLTDLLRRTQLAARNWPEPLPPGSTTATFDRSTVEGAVGTAVTPGQSVGSVSVSFTGVVATGVGSDGSNISFDYAGGYAGIGVAGGGNALLQSTQSESLEFQFSTTNNQQFAVTLGDFGTYDGGRYLERAVFTFKSGGAVVDTKTGVGCRVDGGLASFQATVSVDFDSVVVTSDSAYDTNDGSLTDLSAFLIADIAACPASPTACVTSLTDFDNICPTL